MMFDQRAKRLTHRLKTYDKDLYAQRSFNGVLSVYRNAYRYVKVIDENNVKLYDLKHSPQFVFALTDNWKTNGAPRDWGSEVVLNRLRQMDAWEDTKLLDKMDKENEKVKESQARDFRNKTEDYLYENHSQIKKAWSDFNTGTLSKREKRKEKLDKNRR